MSVSARVWTRGEAENHPLLLLEEAKAGGLQRITDADGVFELVFVPTVRKLPIGVLLARGGPDTDDAL
ncbi:hypothetical protein ASG58_11475 [Rhizobium sp. Leaf383]|nr:hypothetical protein ASG58_11475 [Rhizobium sp. Leaf383]